MIQGTVHLGVMRGIPSSDGTVNTGEWQTTKPDFDEFLHTGQITMDTALSIADFCEQVEAAVKAGGASEEALQQLVASFDMATKTCLEVANGGEWE